MSEHYSAHVDDFARRGLPRRDLWPELLLDLPELHYPARLNAASVLLDEQAGRIGDRPCVHTGDGAWTYHELLERSNRIARVLAEDMAIVPGNRVLLHGLNGAELIALWLGVLKAGAVAVATMPLLRAGELAEIIERAQVTHALADARCAAAVAEAQREQPVLRELLTFGPGGELESRAQAKPTAFTNVDTANDDVALIAFTSGTTGKPKGCIHFHRDILAICDTYARSIVQPQADDVFAVTAPLAFTFGLGALVLFPLRFGASTAPIERPGTDAVFEAVRRHRVTTLFTAPTAYRALLRAGNLDDLASLHTCVAAGETLPAATSNAWFDRKGIRILDGIGSTEMLHIFISAPAGRVKAGSTGTPVPGYEAMVVGDDMQPLPAGEVGRLAVRGPTGCRYLSDSRQTTYVVDGWNVTGDAYMADDDGYFWFQARTDDMIVTSGYNISGPEVEAILLEHDAVAECAVVASPDEERGNVVKAFVVLAESFDGDDTLAGELQAHVKARIAPYKYPRRIEFIDELPKTQTGKIQRFRLRTLEAESARQRLLSER